MKVSQSPANNAIDWWIKVDLCNIIRKMDESRLWIYGNKINLKAHRIPKLPLRKFYYPKYFLQNTEAEYSAKHQIANHYRDFKLKPDLKLQCNYLTKHLRNIRNKVATARSKCYRSKEEQRQQLPVPVCYLSSSISQSGGTLIPYNDTVRRILSAADNYELLKQLTERYLRQIHGKIYRSSLANKVKLCYDKVDINCCQKCCNYSQAISKTLDSETTVRYSPTIWNCYGSINTREFVSDYLESNALENSKYYENVDKRKQLEQQIDIQYTHHRLNTDRLEAISTTEVAEDDHQTEYPFHIQTQIKNQNDIITKSSKSITTTPLRTTICEPTISINITRDRSGRSARPNKTEGNKRHHQSHHTNNEQQQQRIRNLQPLKSSLGKFIRDQNIKDQNSSPVLTNIANEENAAQLIRIEIKQIVLNEKRP